MAKKKDNSVDLAFNEFDTLINTFFKEATASLIDLQKPLPPSEKTQKKQLPKISNPFRI
tara:strand:+ start:1193 stop:1369 length:177 start_codon:yes stop_codon:yes gene_type:complete